MRLGEFRQLTAHLSDAVTLDIWPEQHDLSLEGPIIVEVLEEEYEPDPDARFTVVFNIRVGLINEDEKPGGTLLDQSDTLKEDCDRLVESIHQLFGPKGARELFGPEEAGKP